MTRSGGAYSKTYSCGWALLIPLEPRGTAPYSCPRREVAEMVRVSEFRRLLLKSRIS
jgi:hypothetical protein